MKYIYIVMLIIIIGSSIYFWHQDRKSNTRERAVDIDSYEIYEVATFAGGCFWCVESDMEKVSGVVDVVSGYTGGELENPTYKDVSGGDSGHREAVQVFYNKDIVSYGQLLDVFWTHTNPTDEGGQFADRGYQYSTAIYYHNQEQKDIALISKTDLSQNNMLPSDIVTPIIEFKKFYIAEDYHQNYHTKNPVRYKHYRDGSGRTDYIEETWGEIAKEAIENTKCITSVCEIKDKDNTTYMKPSQEELKKILTELQYKVTQESGTEKAFDNEYWDNKEEGIYVDILSGEVLFSSTHKYVSGTGWPTFTKPLEPENIVEKEDKKLFVTRTEIKSKNADSHIGHVFNDGPEDAGGLRYCMNSAAMLFVPKSELEGTKYEKYLELF